jgi:hypothetical protein
MNMWFCNGGGAYNPSNLTTSSYGLTSSIDDFAESFADSVLRQNGENLSQIPNNKN